MTLTEIITTCQTRLEKLFAQYLYTPNPAPELQKAIAYGVLNGGKRVRPLLVYATGYTLDVIWENLDPAACAIEFIHAYSLIHDDLPAMDNADLRRGKPSCHKAFNEALAILAGDALQPLAFEVIATHAASLAPIQRLDMITLLSQASGGHGMVAGQALDLAGTDDLLSMYQLKTGALLTASVKLAAIAADVKDNQIITGLETYARNLGLAFQIQDDLLDYEKSDITGKPQQLDSANNKLTYPAIVGIDKTRRYIEELFHDAHAAIEALGPRSNVLHELANYLMNRKY